MQDPLFLHGRRLDFPRGILEPDAAAGRAASFAALEAGKYREGQPAESGVSLSPGEIPFQFFDAKRAHHTARAEQLLERQPSDPRKLSGLARRKSAPRIERDRHLFKSSAPTSSRGMRIASAPSSGISSINGMEKK